MRFHIVFAFWMLTCWGASAQSLKEINASVDQFLKSNVQAGLVDYEGVASNPSELNGIISKIEATALNEEGSNLEKAFLVNAYNMFVIKQVIDNHPIKSPTELSEFFTDKKFRIGDKKMSLNYLEKGIIFPKYPDARLHFALVCAAKGCPKLRSEAYGAETLEAQLEAQSAVTLKDSVFANYEPTANTLNISKIFEWYAADFGKNKAEIIEFVNLYTGEAIPSDSKLNYLNYDWALNELPHQKTDIPELSNLQLFTPSALFTAGEFEVNVFNSIYSQQNVRNADGELVPLGQTQNFFTSMIMFTTGISKKARINVGLDLFISKARTVTGDASAFDVFNTTDEAVFNKTLISYIAPRIKFVPLKSIPRLSIQSALWIPLSDELESEGFVAHDRYTWFTQVFFDQNVGENFQIFLEADLLYRFATKESQAYDFFRTPLSGFLSWFPTSKSTLFAFTQYSPRFETTSEMDMEEFGLTQWFTQIGIGGKYQITDALGLELSYSNFALSRLEGAGYTVNFGLRYIHR